MNLVPRLILGASFFMALFLPINILHAVEKQIDSTYMLGIGTTGAKALAIQQGYLKKNSCNQLTKAGLKPGMKVYDIGCGSGEMTAYLAQQVGENGLVYAVDESEEQLTLTKKRIEALKLTNVRYIQADIQTYQDWDLKQADIVYARLLLMHLPHPKNALKNMYNLLKSGGILSLQETTWSTVHCSLSCKALEKYRDAVIALGKMRGADYNLGAKLPQVCQELDFKIVYANEEETTVKINVGKALIIARIPELRSRLIEAKTTTAEDFDSWMQIISELPEENDKAYINVANMMHILVEKNN